MLTDVGQEAISVERTATPAFRQVSLSLWASPNEAAA
jgi:hypothetical protein